MPIPIIGLALPEIDWYSYQGANPATMCIVWHQTLIKANTSKVSHQILVCPPLHILNFIHPPPKLLIIVYNPSPLCVFLAPSLTFEEASL